MVTNQQLYLAIGIPLLFNASLIALLIALMNSKLDAFRHEINAQFSAMDARFERRFAAIDIRLSQVEARFGIMDAKFDAINARLDTVDDRFDAVDRQLTDMRELWRSELRRVEDILDARLKHIESH